MIYLLKPRGVQDCYYKQALENWTQQAQQWNTPIESMEYTSQELRRIWDSANHRSDRVVLATPFFIPVPSMWQELDYLQREKQYIVVLQDYMPKWNMGLKMIGWEPNGVLHDLIVFQLAGQQRQRVPLSSVSPIWTHLEEARQPWIYRVPGNRPTRWSIRSNLGEVFKDCFSNPTVPVLTWGKNVLGRPYFIRKAEVLEQWREAQAGWHLWVGRRLRRSGRRPLGLSCAGEL